MRKRSLILFFISGFCALLYQLVWVRLAFTHFGAITPVLSIVVSVFMLGLGIGSWWGGRWATRSTTSPLTAYAIVEGLTGLSAFAVPWLFQCGDTWLLTRGAMDSQAYLQGSALWIAGALLPWCTAMGMTFPLMMEAWRRDRGESTSFSALYTANVLGALAGTALTALALIELFGFRNTLILGGALNFAVCAVSLWMSAHYPLGPANSAATANALSSQPLPSSFVLSTLALTGCITLSMEVLWTRMFTPILLSTIYSFASVLGVYLLATWIGTRRYRRDMARGTPISAGMLLLWISSAALLPLLINDPRLPGTALGVLLSLFPLCAGLGYLTPLLVDHYAQGDPAKAGWAYAVNTAGCILGPLLTTYLFLPHAGAKEVLLLLSAPLLVLSWLARSTEMPRRRHALSLCIVLGLGVGVWGLGRTHEEPLMSGTPWVVRRDPTATVISTGTGMNKRLLVNGINTTNLSTIAKLMAHLAMVSHPTPAQNGLSICFGMGTTFRGLLSWGLESTGVDIVPGVIQAFDYYYDDVPAIQQNPRAHLVVDDGRRFLRRTPQAYDILTVDPPPHIESAGLSLLYSKEFLALANNRLKEGGVFHLWFPIWGEPKIRAALARSIAESFPYTQVYLSLGGWGHHFLASNQPLSRPTVDQFVQQMPPLARKDLLEWEKDPDVRHAVAPVLAKPMAISDLYNASSAVITDDRPYNEYYFLRRTWRKLQKGWMLLNHATQ